jgi:hypothetical protein
MDDSQSPPDAENRKGDSARRASLRLRDAEVVATIRRDMFGDGSLLDAPADPPQRAEEDQGLTSNAEASAGSAQPQPADRPQVAGADGLPPQTYAAGGPDTAGPPVQAAAPERAQPLDAIIDSFPADPQSQTAGRQAGSASDRAPTAGPERRQVSAIFEGLESPPPNASEAAGVVPPLTDSPLERMARRPGAAAGAASGEEAADAFAPKPSAASMLRLGVPLFYQPSALPPMPVPSDWPAMPEAGADMAGDGPRFDDEKPSRPDQPPARADAQEWPPLSGARTDGAHTAATEPAPFPEPTDWPPMAPLAGAEAPQAPPEQPASLDQPADQPPERSGGVEPYPEPIGWPPFPEPPGTQAAAGHAAELEPPSLVRAPEPLAGASASPFPAPPEWPPFPEAPGAEAGLSPPKPAGLPPYIELPAHPERSEEQPGPLGPAAFTEPPPYAAPPSFTPPPGPFPDTPETFAEAQPFARPRGLPAFDNRAATALREAPRFHGLEADTDARASADATAKIAAEANATAQALDNLQRLLNKTISPAAPPPQPVRPRAQPRRPHTAGFHLPQNDPMSFAQEMAPMLPLPVPPPERSNRNVYLLGFLTGLVLSVMAGAALYFLINAG